MSTYFAEVLACERASLAEVTDRAQLTRWRRRVVEELMTPRSPYASALRQTGDAPDRADFLHRWRRLIAETVERLQQAESSHGTNCPGVPSSARSRTGGVDAQQAAVLILAALYGGSTLSQVAQSPWPLNAALDLALAPLGASGTHDRDSDRIE